MAECKSCGAAIIWLQTPKGKSMPVDAEPRADGNLYYLAGLIHVGDTPPGTGAQRYTAHWVTCPDGPLHRKARK